MKVLQQEGVQPHSTQHLYQQLAGKKTGWLLTITAIVLALLCIDILTGPSWLTLQEVIYALFSPERVSANTSVIVWVMRLPIALMALLVGASLGVAGAEMQTILNNPLASPYTLGISSAASFGAALAIVFGRQMIPNGELILIPLNAFAFAIASALLINFISKVRYGGTQTIILTGVAFHFLFSSLLAFIQYIARENELQAIVFWMFGSLQAASWSKITIVGIVLLITLYLLLSNSWKLTALKFGDEKVKSMGINADRLRLYVLFLIAVLTAVSVCFVGAIGFVGLVAPHLARAIMGEDQRFFLPCSALFGAIMLSCSSIASKLIIPGTLIPVGITTSLIGIPFLLHLIFKTKRTY